MTKIENKDLFQFEEAINNKDLKTVTKMVNKNQAIVNEINAQGILFLNLAITTDYKITMLLIENGANVNKLDNVGFTPIYNMIKAIDSLLLQDTSAEEIYQMFQLIIKKGTLLNIQDRRGNTPINYTSQQAKSTKPGYEVYTKVGKIILALDVNVSETIQIKNNMGKSPLDYLSRNGNVILRDAVFSKLPHIQEAINRTMAETETATHKILRSTSDKVLP